MVYNILSTLMVMVIVYWLYYRRYILDNPNKPNDAWF